MKIKLFFFFVVLPVALFSLYTWGALSYVYSKGERAGYLQKFSRKGWVFKTWEGEISMINLPGTAPEKFDFSVRNDEIANKVAAQTGQRVNVTYEEHRGIPVKWFGETRYFVVDVRPILDLQQAVPNTPK